MFSTIQLYTKTFVPTAMNFLKDSESLDHYNDVWFSNIFRPGWAAASRQMVKGTLLISGIKQ